MDVDDNEIHNDEDFEKVDNDSEMNADQQESDEGSDHGSEIYLPGRSRPLRDDEELEMDKSVYRMYYRLEVDAPSLSFEPLLDHLGDSREVEVNGKDPLTIYLAAGTQASSTGDNSIVVMRLSNMNPMTSKEIKEDDETDSDESESESESEDEDLDREPDVEAARIKHPSGTVNRIRTRRIQDNYYAAAWSEAGEVSIWNLNRPLLAVNDSAVMAEYTRNHESPPPLLTFKGHKTEGYGLAWNPSGCLATGDNDGAIYIWQPRPSGWAVSKQPYRGHKGSVEDIQWSPTEPTVFITTSTDRSFRVWDTRSGPKASAMINVADAHASDVNVATWSGLQPGTLLTGADDGCLRVWDLRMVHQKYSSKASSTVSDLTAYTHSFDFHTSAITSVEWHPTEAGIFLASSEDDTTTLWDIGLEQDAAGESGDAEKTKTELPVQLLFLHMGQQEVRESHWHPQVPGLVVSTALDGFNVFRSICV